MSDLSAGPLRMSHRQGHVHFLTTRANHLIWSSRRLTSTLKSHPVLRVRV